MRRPPIVLRPALMPGLVLILLMAIFLCGMPALAQTSESTQGEGTLGSAAAGPGAIAPPSLSQGPGPADTYADLKLQYFAALERIVELEQAYQEALDLARGYRSDLEDQKALAEARKLQTEQALELANTLTKMINELKDIINKQHEIILKLTSRKPLSLGFSAGVSLQPKAMAGGDFSLQPGVTLGVIVF